MKFDAIVKHNEQLINEAPWQDIAYPAYTGAARRPQGANTAYNQWSAFAKKLIAAFGDTPAAHARVNAIMNAATNGADLVQRLRAAGYSTYTHRLPDALVQAVAATPVNPITTPTADAQERARAEAERVQRLAQERAHRQAAILEKVDESIEKIKNLFETGEGITELKNIAALLIPFVHQRITRKPKTEQFYSLLMTAKSGASVNYYIDAMKELGVEMKVEDESAFISALNQLVSRNESVFHNNEFITRARELKSWQANTYLVVPGVELHVILPYIIKYGETYKNEASQLIITASNNTVASQDIHKTLRQVTGDMYMKACRLNFAFDLFWLFLPHTAQADSVAYFTSRITVLYHIPTYATCLSKFINSDKQSISKEALDNMSPQDAALLLHTLVSNSQASTHDAIDIGLRPGLRAVILSIIQTLKEAHTLQHTPVTEATEQERNRFKNVYNKVYPFTDSDIDNIHNTHKAVSSELNKVGSSNMYHDVNTRDPGRYLDKLHKLSIKQQPQDVDSEGEIIFETDDILLRRLWTFRAANKFGIPIRNITETGLRGWCICAEMSLYNSYCTTTVPTMLTLKKEVAGRHTRFMYLVNTKTNAITSCYNGEDRVVPTDRNYLKDVLQKYHIDTAHATTILQRLTALPENAEQVHSRMRVAAKELNVNAQSVKFSTTVSGVNSNGDFMLSEMLTYMPAHRKQSIGDIYKYFSGSDKPPYSHIGNMMIDVNIKLDGIPKKIIGTLFITTALGEVTIPYNISATSFSIGNGTVIKTPDATYGSL